MMVLCVGIWIGIHRSQAAAWLNVVVKVNAAEHGKATGGKGGGEGGGGTI